MSRTPPTIYEEHLNVNGLVDQVVSCQGVFVVLYNNEPFNIRSQTPDGTWTYKKTTFPNKGHALRLVDRLTEKYGSGKFTLEELK